MELIIAAVIAAVPATIAATASWRTNRELKSPNGLRTGVMVEEVYRALKAHIEDPEAHHGKDR